MKQFNNSFKIASCNNGKEAVEFFEIHNKVTSNNNIELIIMDCEMPIMNGFIATSEINNKIY